ncbi:TetR/AcrR family transcriptional regulator [Sporanaerobacter sp. PP17-6a]|uniref:TetR/AcrR family transcriptional regulator n=1 Tax=Sporanaerobacter sp. PP17-6a TaxID=1891289 RepID=UPI00089FFF24|nr:TetR/AcrR family transcriptional regulator [Sporanaerobacter sp. PP17-6a]SCL94562.1 Fatty acid metabolism regulator protein [Sporanaerobacter sp. PP17-6a]
MPKVVNYEERKAEIIEKAKALFIKRGYFNTNISDISNSCGFGRTTIYQYFKNKDEIFYYAISETLEEIKGKVETIVTDKDLTIVEKLKKLVFELTNEYEYNHVFIIVAEICVILKMQNNKIVNKIKEYFQEIMDSINDLISQGIESKEIKPIDSEGMAETIFSFINSFIIQQDSYSDIDFKKRLSSLNILIDGLRA